METHINDFLKNKIIVPDPRGGLRAPAQDGSRQRHGGGHEGHGEHHEVILLITKTE